MEAKELRIGNLIHYACCCESEIQCEITSIGQEIGIERKKHKRKA